MPPQSDFILHLFGGIILSWVVNHFYIALFLAIIAEIIQPIFGRGFEYSDLGFNVLAVCIYFLLLKNNNSNKNKKLFT